MKKAGNSFSPIASRVAAALKADGSSVWRLVFLSVCVGLIAGLGAAGFFVMLEAAKHLFLHQMAGYYPDGPGGEPGLFEVVSADAPRRWVLFLVPSIGGLLSGLLVWKFAPEAEGHGTDAAIEAYHYKAGRVRARVPFVKAVSSALTIGSGGSGGREGPIAQIGAGFGSMLGGWLGLGARERRILMASGMAAGVGAIFHAPMAGALFAAEVLYRELDLEYEAIIPSIVSSITAYAVFCLFFGSHSLFVTPGFAFTNPLQLIPYLVLGVAVAGGAFLYIKVFYLVRDLSLRSGLPLWIRPAIGGLIVGAIGLLAPDALGTGYGIVQKGLVYGTELEATFGSIGIGLLLAVFAGKILTTSFSIGTGGSGGVFGPAIVIGGALGGAVGIIAQKIFPGLDIQPGAFVLVGMAGFFGGAANTPISTVIMVSEMTGNYRLLVPSMWVCVISYMLVQRWALYEKQLSNRFETPVHMGNMIEAILRNMKVGEVLRGQDRSVAITSISPEARLSEMLESFAALEQSSFPVVDSEGRIQGLVKGRELRSLALPDHGLNDLLLAEDVMSPPVTVTSEEDLLHTTRLMTANNIEEVVVVDSIETGRPVAVLTHRNVVASYHTRLLEKGGV